MRNRIMLASLLVLTACAVEPAPVVYHPAPTYVHPHQPYCTHHRAWDPYLRAYVMVRRCH